MIYLSYKIINEIRQYQKDYVILDMVYCEMVKYRCMHVKDSHSVSMYLYGKVLHE